MVVNSTKKLKKIHKQLVDPKTSRLRVYTASSNIQALYNKLIGKFTKENINKVSKKNKSNLKLYLIHKRKPTNRNRNRNHQLHEALEGVFIHTLLK